MYGGGRANTYAGRAVSPAAPRWGSQIQPQPSVASQSQFARTTSAASSGGSPRGISPRARSPTITDAALAHEVAATVDALVRHRSVFPRVARAPALWRTPQAPPFLRSSFSLHYRRAGIDAPTHSSCVLLTRRPVGFACTQRGVLSPDQCSRCKVSPDRLLRPKLLFLLRIVNAVTEATGFGFGLFDDALGQEAIGVIANASAYEKDRVRRGKIEYFNRLQQVICEALGEPEHPASTRAIITGAEPARTNVMLQKLCHAAQVASAAPVPESRFRQQGGGGGQQWAMSQEQILAQQMDQQRSEHAELNRQTSLLAEQQRHALAEQQRIAEQERYETRQEMQRMSAMKEQQQQQHRLDEQRRHFPSRQQQQQAPVPEGQTPALQPARAPRPRSPDPASLHMLSQVRKHAEVLSDPSQTQKHESAFNALLGHVADRPAAHGKEIEAKNMAAEMLHQHITRFPHLREEVIDALCQLDDEFNAHEATAAGGVASNANDWLATAPLEVRQTAAFQQLAQQHGAAC